VISADFKANAIEVFIQANYFKKYLAENAVNTISEPLDFKIFCGGCPQTPYKLAPPALVFRRTFSEKYAPPSLNLQL